jgi:hypothetical protein
MFDILPIRSNKASSWEDANVSREDVEVRLIGNDGGSIGNDGVLT